MTVEFGPKGWFDKGQAIWLLLVLQGANLIIKRWMPGSILATVVSYGFITYVSVWFGLRIRAGYRRRRPHWTRESWMRYLRLAALPVVAVIVVLTMSTEWGMTVMRPDDLALRRIWIVVLLGLLLFGAGGIGVAVDWMQRGVPSEQFTRTRWFQRRKPSAAAG